MSRITSGLHIDNNEPYFIINAGDQYGVDFIKAYYIYCKQNNLKSDDELVELLSLYKDMIIWQKNNPTSNEWIPNPAYLEMKDTIISDSVQKEQERTRADDLFSLLVYSVGILSAIGFGAMGKFEQAAVFALMSALVCITKIVRNRR